MGIFCLEQIPCVNFSLFFLSCGKESAEQTDCDEHKGPTVIPGSLFVRHDPRIILEVSFA